MHRSVNRHLRWFRIHHLLIEIVRYAHLCDVLLDLRQHERDLLFYHLTALWTGCKIWAMQAKFPSRKIYGSDNTCDELSARSYFHSGELVVNKLGSRGVPFACRVLGLVIFSAK